MNGNRFLLDTNVIISLLQGNDAILQILRETEWVGISVISKLEYLSLPDLPKRDESLFAEFLRRVCVVSLYEEQTDLIEEIIHIRKRYRLKLRDAVITVKKIWYGV